MTVISQKVHHSGHVPSTIHQCAFWLAVVATSTAGCVSMVAGWQRGGWLSERILWVSIGVVLTVSAHLLPALCRFSPVIVRCVSGALWAACMVATCYGHATFFLLAQQHAGESRAKAVAPSVVAPVASSGRNLAAIVTALAKFTGRRCSSDCAATRLKRISLTARLDALDTEADEAKRQEIANDRMMAAQDRETAFRDAARADPVATDLAALFGTRLERIDVLSGLAFAGVLESVACLLWFVAFQPRDPMTVSPVAPPQAGPVTASNEEVMAGHTVCSDFATHQQPKDLESEATRLAREIAAGRLRATVADIRRYLGCSQARASALRRQLNGVYSP
jgi:hypothetical protein